MFTEFAHLQDGVANLEIFYSVKSSSEIESYYGNYEATFYIFETISRTSR